MPLTMTGPPLSGVFGKAAKQVLAKVQQARESAAKQVADEIKQAGDKDLQSAGNFGGWTGGFKATPDVGVSTTIKVTIDAPFWWIVHQEGRTIMGKPWLAIPLSFAGVPKGMYARDYPGGLGVGARGLLFSKVDKQAKYVLKQSVTIPKRLHLVEVSKEAAGKFGDHFNQALKV